jgi:hypothetical protein
MSKHPWMVLGGVVLAAALASSPVLAQTPAHDPSARLRAVLPAEIADRVLATIADARARALPAAALEQRALELDAKGASAKDIEADVKRHASSFGDAQAALKRGGRANPAAEETEAAASAMSKGVDGSAVSDMAKRTPSSRSLAVPLYVLSSLMDRGLPSDEALSQVWTDLDAQASDEQMQRRARPANSARAQGTRPVSPPLSTPGAGRIPVPAVRGADAPEVPTGTPGRRP